MPDGPDLLGNRIRALRVDVTRQLQAIFNEIEDAADAESYGKLMVLAERYERERDEAQEALRQARMEITQLHQRSHVLPEHAATVIDAALTLRTTVAGLTNAPMTSVGEARVLGQLNKALEAFNTQTEGLL